LLAAQRGVVLLVSLLVCFLRFGWIWASAVLRGRAVTPAERALWMQFCGRIVLKAMGIGYRVEGELPRSGSLIAANHLSYLDIVICSAAAPCAFVAKQEIGKWPFFGRLARLGGTIFLDRQSRASAWEAAEAMAERMRSGVPVLFFPEGTSTDGSEVLRFHSTLFAPAVEAGIGVVPAAVFYEPPKPATERDLCWFGNDSFLPHLLRVLRVTGFTAAVRFAPAEVYPDRQTAAWRSHDTVARMRQRREPV
jgi:1-acyl-sn-glycerol-3-phosphate acyltransferase